MLVFKDNKHNLAQAFLDGVELFSSHVALETREDSFSYQELYQATLKNYVALESFPDLVNTRFVGIACQRSSFAFQSILASLLHGKAYVPIDLNADSRRVADIIETLDIKCLCVDENFLKQHSALIAEMQIKYFLMPSQSDCAREFPQHHFVYLDTLNAEQGNKDYSPDVRASVSNIKEDDLAYVLFTSGSTGNPKAVPITHKNICAYIENICKHYPVSSDDRCTQAFDLTFDPSVHDMFVTWLNGATLCLMDDRERLGAQYFIQKHGITIWNTIPSLVKLCQGMRSFNAERLKALRRIFFNGEALQVSVVKPLQKLNKKAELINLYGLTETTVNLSHYRWVSGDSENHMQNGFAPIGHLFDNIEHQILDGELVLRGPQVFPGYLEKSLIDSPPCTMVYNRKSFIPVDGLEFFKTGDQVVESPDGVLAIVGRLDEQVKILGKRVDLNALRQSLEDASACVDALVFLNESASGEKELVGVLQGESFDADAILAKCNDTLEQHMRLRRLVVLESYPYLVSGKIDKKSLSTML